MLESPTNYSRRYDWEEDDNDATVYLSPYLRIRLTDPDKNPLPNARCRIAGDEDTIFTCDEDGIVKIPPPESGETSLNLEWEPEDASGDDESERFYWKTSFQLVATISDEECSTRLANLGFFGDTLADQVTAYQVFFGQDPTGRLADIRDEMVEWHDGGDYPERKTGEPETDENNETEEDEIILCLLDYDRNPMPGARCRIADDDTIYTSDESGEVTIPLPADKDRLLLEWEPQDAQGTEDESTFYMNQLVFINNDGTDDAAISQRLMNLGFYGDNLSDQKDAYAYFYEEDSSDSNTLAASTYKNWIENGQSFGEMSA